MQLITLKFSSLLTVFKQTKNKTKQTITKANSATCSQGRLCCSIHLECLPHYPFMCF